MKLCQRSHRDAFIDVGLPHVASRFGHKKDSGHASVVSAEDTILA